jgi:2Fe-2S ferredoxin
MVRITYIEHSGTEHTVEVAPGLSLMEGAKRNDVPGIDADCGGACQCGTCHVFVDAAWESRTGKRNDLEDAVLDFAEGVKPNSRLACQIKVTEELDGLVVRMPESQR